MSYAIMRIQKITSGTVKGIQIHYQREMDTKLKEQNVNLKDKSKHLNFS